ncbi:MAG TPA: HAD family hydrolase [Thermoplasmata archaeon]|nr:HAD family hydrolase [Thermoplasmata archaeon]
MASPPASPFRAVLLDLDDTLVPWQTVPHWQWAWRPRGPVLAPRHALSAIHRSLKAWDRRRWQGLTGETAPADAAAYRAHLTETLSLLAGHELPAEENAAVVQRFLKPAGEIETYPEVARELSNIAAVGLKVGVVSSLPAEAARQALHRVSLDRLPLVTSGDATPSLPAPAAFRSAAGQLDVKPGEVLFVGDLFWSDVRAGNRAGVHAVLLDRDDRFARVLGPRIRSLSDVVPLTQRPPGTTPETSTDEPGPE